MSVNRYECGLTNAPTEYQSPTMYQDENGGYVSYEDYAALEAKCAALAAEKEKFAVECAATKIAIAYLKSGRQDFTLNTPATDAYLAEVRAQGVEMVIAYHRERADALHHVDRNNAIRHSMAALDASDVAAQLRQEADQ